MNGGKFDKTANSTHLTQAIIINSHCILRHIVWIPISVYYSNKPKRFKKSKPQIYNILIVIYLSESLNLHSKAEEDGKWEKDFPEAASD